jgi:Lon protease-like protein
MPRSEPDLRLDKIQQGLLQEIENAQRNLPANVEEVTEAFERHARIIALLVRSLEAMLKLEKQKNQEQQKNSDPQTRSALLIGIEKRLGELADQSVRLRFSDGARHSDSRPSQPAIGLLAPNASRVDPRGRGFSRR